MPCGLFCLFEIFGTLGKMLESRWRRGWLLGRIEKNGGAREDSAIPARALLATDQGRPHSNYIEASIRWIRPRAWHVPARTLYERAARTRF
jgi:hypothetical protein